MNATHLGCAPLLEPVPVQWNTVDPGCGVVDVITNPRITPLLATAPERGCPVVDGVELLVQLAMQIFERWSGLTPEEEVFQRAVAAALGEEGGIHMKGAEIHPTPNRNIQRLHSGSTNPSSRVHRPGPSPRATVGSS